MSGQIFRFATSPVCAYCGEPLVFSTKGVKAWRAGDLFVCNEFCADGIPTPDNGTSKPPVVLRLRQARPWVSDRVTPFSTP
jgi:hypothetical protein